MKTITEEQLDGLIKSAVNSSGPLPPDEKFLQIISALRELQEYRNAQQVVPGDISIAIENLKQKLVDCNRYNYCSDSVKGVEEAIRAAMQPASDMAAQLESARLHIAELEAAPPAPVGEGDAPLELLPDFPGRTLTQRECYRAGFEAGKALRDGWVAVPVEPTEDMIVEGFESEPDEIFSDERDWEAYDAMSGCQQAAHRAKLCWAAMISAAPKI